MILLPAAALFAAVCAAALLIGSNMMVTGYATGSPRGAGIASFSEIVFHGADFGLSLVAAFQNGAALLLKSYPIARLAVGLTIFLSILGLALRGLLLANKNTPWQAPAALAVLCYAGGLVALRSLSAFDDLDSPRFSVPILAPVLYLVPCTLKLRPLPKVAVSAIFLLLGVVFAARGISPETFGDTKFARAYLSHELPSPSTVYVNDQALSLVAYLDGKVVWVESPEELSRLALREGDVIVIAAKRAGRDGRKMEWDSEWLKSANALVASGKAKLEARDETSIVLRGL